MSVIGSHHHRMGPWNCCRLLSSALRHLSVGGPSRAPLNPALRTSVSKGGIVFQGSRRAAKP